MDWLCLAKEVGNAANETCKHIILDKLKECYSYVVNYKENRKLLQQKYDELKITRGEIDSRVKREEDNLRVRTERTKAWFEKVKQLMEEADEELKKKKPEDEEEEEERKGSRDMMRCIRHSRCNLCRRYDMSKKAKLKADEFDDVIKDKPEDVTEPVSRHDLKAIPNEFLKGLRSRVDLMEEILKKLRDDQVKALGIFGMGAIGKTTLVTEISSHEEMKTMFNEIVMVEISEVPNVERIQNQIAEKIGLKWDDMHSVEQRRTTLYNRLEKASKILIILDNIWSKLDLGKVGIPKPDVKSPNEFVKILVTSREKNVCEAMDISKGNIFEVKPLEFDESKQLFRTRIGAKINNDGWKDKQREAVERRMLNRCGGLPLAIVALADVLKNEESLEAWQHFATELEKPMSNRLAKVSGVHRQAYSILETSYKLMEDEKKKSFFLLACLFPFGASIPIEEMMRYGIGLDLFENVNNLTEAMEQASRWVQELKSSSLLLEADGEYYYKKNHVKIHDVVRASTISLAEQGGEKIMVESLPRWMSLKSCSKYYAISLMSGSNHSRLNELYSENLGILRLDYTEGGFEDTFFQGMNNLMVLVMRRMGKRRRHRLMTRKVMKLPSSITNLKSSLTTLMMERCVLGDITDIGELTNLVVLSLRESFLEEIPKEIGNLCNLRLLDLSNCIIKKKGIAANVLSNLSLLEGLYAFDSIIKWHSYNKDGNSEVEPGEYEYASIGELNHLSYLKVVDLQLVEWPIIHHDENELQFLKHLDHFRILFEGLADHIRTLAPTYHYSRDVKLRHLSNTKDIRVLLENTQYLKVSDMEKLQHIFEFDDIHGHGQRQQKQPIQRKSSSSSFINNDDNLHAHEFPFLQELEVHLCPEMESLSSTPFQAPNLTQLLVNRCYKMKYIFMEYDANAHHHQLNNIITFPCLKIMQLWYLSELESVIGYIKSPTITSTNDDDPQLQQPQLYTLFNSHNKPIFPKLEELTLWGCSKIGQLWEVNCKEMSYYSSFTNLHKLEIRECEKLETLGSLSIATALVQLKTLSIEKCPLLREVISSSKEEEEEEHETKAAPISISISGDEIFPSLETVFLQNCPNLKVFIHGEKLKDQFLKLSSLHLLQIQGCPEIDSFSSGPSFKTPKLNKVLLDSSEYPMQETKHNINSFLQIHNNPN